MDTLEPLTQVANVGEPNAAGVWTLDPLQYLIEQAHLRGIEVHAFVIIGSIYNAHPTITGLPRDPTHIFNQHFWDKSTGALFPVTDPRQWSTRALPHNLTTGANPTKQAANTHAASHRCPLIVTIRSLADGCIKIAGRFVCQNQRRM